MPNLCITRKHSRCFFGFFTKAKDRQASGGRWGTLAVRLQRAVCLALLLAFCPAVLVSAGDTVESNGGVVTGGSYLNIWHNAPGFSYWGDSLIPNGNYSLWPGNYGTGPENKNRSTSLNGNTIILHNGTVAGSIWGAIDDTLAADPRPHNVTNNHIIVYSGTVGSAPTAGNNFVETTSGNLFGGWTNAGHALNNRVDIYNGTMRGSVYGGLSKSGHANDNRVFIGGDAVEIGDETNTIEVTVVEGWVNDWANSVPVPENIPSFDEVINELATKRGLTRGPITPAEEEGLVKALMEELGLESRDTDDTTIALGGNVYGGSSSGGGNALRNTVIMTSGSVADYLHGGYSIYGAASENTVNISGGDVGQKVYGGYTRAGSAEFNKVILSGNAVVGSKPNGWGGYVYGGWTDSPGGVIESNEVILSGNAQVKKSSYGYGGSVYGGYAEYSDTFIQNNTVTLNGNVEVETDVFGGYTNGTSLVLSNNVTINGGTVGGNVYGGGGSSDWFDGDRIALVNNVTINSGTVAGNVYGGYAYALGDSLAIAENNQVNINGGKVSGNIYGGWAKALDVDGTAEAVSNEVNIRGNPNLTDAHLYGGWAEGGKSSNAFDGNMLNVYSSNITVAGLHNFKQLHFYIPDTLPVGGTMLLVSDGIAGVTDVGDTYVALSLSGSRSPLKGGDYFVLIDSNGKTDGMVGDPENDSWATGGGTTRARQGATLLYEFEIRANTGIGLDPGDDTGNELWAILPYGRGGEPTVDPKTESLSKGFLTGMSLLNQGQDLITWHGMSGAIRAAREARHNGYGIFFDISGGRSRYDTGCHVDLSGVSLITGLSKYRDVRAGHLTWGGFFEYGDGSYDTNSTFADAGLVRGKGNTHYLGGGMLGRLDFNQIGSGHFYTEASFRAGGLKNGYYNGDIRDALGVAASYDSSATYYGLHAGVGKIRHLRNTITLDLYGKYIWTSLQGDSVTLSTGDPIDFHAVNSHRLRLGGRYSGAAIKTFKPYLGAAWEYEFDGDARASTSGYAIGVPSLRGSTGIGELGISWKPAKYRSVYIDCGVQGYLGKREGASAILQIGRNF